MYSSWCTGLFLITTKMDVCFVCLFVYLLESWSDRGINKRRRQTRGEVTAITWMICIGAKKETNKKQEHKLLYLTKNSKWLQVQWNRWRETPSPGERPTSDGQPPSPGNFTILHIQIQNFDERPPLSKRSILGDLAQVSCQWFISFLGNYFEENQIQSWWTPVPDTGGIRS